MISRRNFLKSALIASVCYPLTAKTAFASGNITRSLNLHNVHTGETLNATYCRNGLYDYQAIERINYLLRCHYTNEVKAIDVGVLNLLCDIKDKIGVDRAIHVISAYRSPLYNDYLRSVGRNVAKNSFHVKGCAIDFSIEGVSKDKLSITAKSFVSGGVGRYSDFVHIDTGPVRYW